jgi:membrane protein implicated in regulation of membrane protease activity
METRVSERLSINQILADCERFWLETRVPRSISDAMKLELESHLYEAGTAGKSPASVVGEDLAQFAESWAAEFRSPAAAESWQRVQRRQSRLRGRLFAVGLTATGLLTIAIGLMTKEEAVEDIQFWLWLWVGAAVVLGIGEMITAGFFLLPFAIAAVVSAMLALLNVHPLIQLIAFAVFSVLSLVAIRRCAKKEEDIMHPVGAKRYVDARGTVTETVDPFTGEGRIRVETEEWRATTDLDQVIEIGTPVIVLEVRGSRMVIEPAQIH